MVAPEIQREAVVSTVSQLRGEGRGGILASLQHLLRMSPTQPRGLMKDHAWEEGLVLSGCCGRPGTIGHLPLLHQQSPDAARKQGLA